MTRVMVFGGTGSIGQLIVKKLLALNFQVKVLTRTIPQETELASARYIQGNVLDYHSVESAMSAGDIIIISLGFNNSPLDTMSKGTENILKAMHSVNCTRVICLSAQGAGESWDHMPDEFKEMVNCDEILSASFKDHSIQESLITSQALDWTIVRPTEVVNAGIPGKQYLVNGFREDLQFQISKFDVADFIAEEALNPQYVKQVVMITC